MFKILFRRFLPPHPSTSLCSNVVKFVRREIGEIVRYSSDQKISAASQTVATARITPKSARASPQHLALTVPDFIQIGSLSADA